MKSTRITPTIRNAVAAAALSGVGLALAIGVAAPAQAKATWFNATPAQFAASCEKANGQHTPNTAPGVSSCVTAQGKADCVDESGHCVFYPNPKRTTSGEPRLPDLVSSTGIAG